MVKLASEELLKNISSKLGRLVHSIQLENGLGYFDKNKSAENFFIQILNITYNYDLINANSFRANYPSVDLVDKSHRIAFQVTSETSGRKYNHTLEKFFEHKLNEEYDELIILCISIEKEPRIKHKFVKTLNIKNLIQDIENLNSFKEMELISQYLDSALIESNTSSKITNSFLTKDIFTRSNAENFLYDQYQAKTDEEIEAGLNMLNKLFEIISGCTIDERKMIYEIMIHQEHDPYNDYGIVVPTSILSERYSYQLKNLLDNLEHKGLVSIDDEHCLDRRHPDSRYVQAVCLHDTEKSDFDQFLALHHYFDGDNNDLYDLIVNLRVDVL